MERMKRIEIREGKRGVRIDADMYGVTLYTMKNGYQWSGVLVDDDILKMIQDAITQHQTAKE